MTAPTTEQLALNDQHKRKSLEFKITDAEKGEVEAVFSTFNVIDHDGDVTLPGAIGDPQKVRMSAYNHSSWDNALPAGKGIVYEKGDEMIFEGRFFMTTENGKDTYETVKAMEDLLRAYGIKELARTGKIALSRGDKK